MKNIAGADIRPAWRITTRIQERCKCLPAQTVNELEMFMNEVPLAYPYLVMPSFTLSEHPPLYLSGVYLGGKPIPELLLFRHYARINFLAPPSVPEVFIDAPSVYCGRFFKHFGHFILESLSRLTHIRYNPSLLCCYIKDHCGDMLPWQKEILSILGIKNTFFEITRPTAFAKLDVPQPGYIIPTEFSDPQNKFLSCVNPENIIKGKKTYLSRRHIENKIQTNEHDAEKILMNHGWSIIYPEELSVKEQLQEISSSAIVLGIEGSAFHSIIFFTELNTKLYGIPRMNSENYVTIARRKNFFYKRIDVGCDGVIDIVKLNYLLENDCFDQHIIPDDEQHRLLCRKKLVRTAQSPIICEEKLMSLLRGRGKIAN